MKILLPLVVCAAVAAGCSKAGADYALAHEDKDAKLLFQGVWMNADEGMPSVMIEGDSIFFPDATSMPATFWIYKDSLYIRGNNVNRYKIVAQAEHRFTFQNQGGDEVRLEKSDDGSLRRLFRQRRLYAMNIFRTTDTDTLCTNGGVAYRSHIHIEPTSDLMVKSSYNDDGVEVDNMYLDNMARLEVAAAGKTIYAHDFRKGEFASFVPVDFMERSILRNLEYSHVDTAAIYYDAVVGIPDASTCYVIGLKVSKDGKLTMKLQ